MTDGIQGALRLRIEGGRRLGGEYRPAGNSNAAVALIATALLSAESTHLANLPRTTSTLAMLETAATLGASVQTEDEGRAIAAELSGVSFASATLSRASHGRYAGTLLLLAPLLCAHERATARLDVPLRRVRVHLAALRALGLVEEAAAGQVILRRRRWGRASLVLTEPSVTATALVLMLAARLGEETQLENAACEPHIQEMGHLLNRMGACVEGMNTNRLVIRGRRELHGASATVGPSHIETASVAAIAALSGGGLLIKGIRATDLRMITQVFRQLGLQLELREDALTIPRQEHPTISAREEDMDAEIETSTWPGFPSDLVAMATLIATQAPRSTLIHERLYDNHLFFVDRLNAMGAQIVLCDPHRALVIGAQQLKGIYMDSPDIRAGLGMIAAALIARGESVLDNAQVIEQSFAGVLNQLVALGAQIEPG